MSCCEPGRLGYLPWIGYNHRADGIIAPRLPSYAHAEEIAAAHHPAWDALSPAVRKLMARNVMQILGRDCLSPASFVVCWAPNSTLDEAGRVVDVAGGTGQAVRIAASYRVPVFNLAYQPHRARIGAWLAGNP